MKKIVLVFFSILVSSFLLAQENTKLISNELIIKFKADKKPNSDEVLRVQKFGDSYINVLNKNNNIKSIKLTGNKKQGDTYVLSFDLKKPIEEFIESYLETGLFEYVEPNFVGYGHGFPITPNDSNFNNQWSHHNDGTFSLSNSTIDADIDTDFAWDITQGSSTLIVAVLDSGLKLDHPEFSGRIWVNSTEVQNGNDTDSNNYIDDINGWDFANDDNNPTDDHGHGTNVTGIALASGNNNIGYAGMNWNSKIMTCKILDSNNSGFYSWWAEAIYYAVDNGASVINLSAGGNGASVLLEDAVNYAHNNNVAVVVSSGNQNSSIQYPAKYANAFAIGSTDSDDTRSVPFFWNATSGSNFGPELDFVAPGNYIYGLSHTSNTNYNTYWGGTSQAAPHVAGLVSLLLSVNSNLTVSEIRAILEQSSEDQVGDSEDTIGWDQYYGHGRINAFQALTNSTLSVNNLEEADNKIFIYPNPTDSEISISTINDNVLSKIDIHDINGKMLKTFRINDKTSQNVNISAFSSGVYFVTIQSNRGQTTKKIIKL